VEQRLAVGRLILQVVVVALTKAGRMFMPVEAQELLVVMVAMGLIPPYLALLLLMLAEEEAALIHNQ
jgi:hypothetical protein